REELLATAAGLGLRLDRGGSVIVAHAQPLAPTDEDWRRRVLAAADRAARAGGTTAVAASSQRPGARDGEIVVLVADPDDAVGRRAAEAIRGEFEANLRGFAHAVGRSRAAEDPMDLHRAGKEARLAANVAQSAQRLFTHRHTIRYRLERVRELTGHDVGSTYGREQLSLGLKAMRVLGIPPRAGPAAEPGTEAGRVPSPPQDRNRS